MKITDIKPQKNKNRLNIFIDGNFAFAISFDLFFHKRLQIGQVLTAKDLKGLIQEDQTEGLFAKSLRFLSFRPRSVKEVEDYLIKKLRLKEVQTSFEQAEYQLSVDQVISKLKQLGQIDDYEFASWWIEQRIRFKPLPTTLLRKELMAKGVAKQVIEEVVQRSKVDDLKSAQIAASKKWKSLKKLERKEALNKLTQFLARKGFAWEVIKKVVDRDLV